MPTDHSLFIRRFDDMFNKPDIAIADEIFAPHFQAHFPLTPTLDLSTFKNFITSFYVAFPDFMMQICDTIPTDDRLIFRVAYFGSHKGDFMGIPATGCDVVMHGIIIFRIEEGIVVENWTEIDILGVIQQVSSSCPC
jgi:predicted ester cyclase